MIGLASTQIRDQPHAYVNGGGEIRHLDHVTPVGPLASEFSVRTMNRYLSVPDLSPSSSLQIDWVAVSEDQTLTMYASCVPSGSSYLLAFGFGAALIVLSSWMVLLMRAVYRDDAGFRRGLANAAPLWAPGIAGVVTLFNFKDSLIGWVQTCLPGDGWSALGSVFIGLGVAVALTAVGRLIYNRIHVGTTGDPDSNEEKTRAQHSSTGDATVEKRPRNLPVERRRVIVEYAITYGTAVLLLVIGAGLSWL